MNIFQPAQSHSTLRQNMVAEIFPQRVMINTKLKFRSSYGQVNKKTLLAALCLLIIFWNSRQSTSFFSENDVLALKSKYLYVVWVAWRIVEYYEFKGLHPITKGRKPDFSLNFCDFYLMKCLVFWNIISAFCKNWEKLLHYEIPNFVYHAFIY